MKVHSKILDTIIDGVNQKIAPKLIEKKCQRLLCSYLPEGEYISNQILSSLFEITPDTFNVRLKKQGGVHVVHDKNRNYYFHFCTSTHLISCCK